METISTKSPLRIFLGLLTYFLLTSTTQAGVSLQVQEFENKKSLQRHRSLFFYDSMDFLFAAPLHITPGKRIQALKDLLQKQRQLRKTYLKSTRQQKKHQSDYEQTAAVFRLRQKKLKKRIQGVKQKALRQKLRQKLQKLEKAFTRWKSTEGKKHKQFFKERHQLRKQLVKNVSALSKGSKSDQALKMTVLWCLAGLRFEQEYVTQQKKGKKSRSAYTSTMNILDKLSKFLPPFSGKDSALFFMTKVKIQQGDVKSALHILKRLLREVPKSSYRAEALLQQGRLYFASSKRKKALRSYQQFLHFNKHPAYHKVKYAVAWIYYLQSQHKRALLEFVQLLDWYQIHGKGSGSLHKEALQHISLILMDEKVKSFPQLLRLVKETVGIKKPYTIQLLFNIAKSRQSMGQGKKAEKVYRVILRNYPIHLDTPTAQLKIMDLLSKRKNQKHLISREKFLFLMYFGKGSAWYKKNQKHTKKLQLYKIQSKKLGLSSPFTPKKTQVISLAFLRAKMAQKQNKWLKAARLFDALAQSHPKASQAPQALWNAAVLFELANKKGQAQKRYEQFQIRYPKSPLAAQALLRLGSQSEKAHRLERAVYYYERLAKGHQDSHHRRNALQQLAQLYDILEKPHRAALTYQQLYASSGKSRLAPQYLFLSALRYRKAKKYSKASAIFQKFINTYKHSRKQAHRIIQAYGERMFIQKQVYQSSVEQGLSKARLNQKQIALKSTYKTILEVYRQYVPILQPHQQRVLQKYPAQAQYQLQMHTFRQNIQEKITSRNRLEQRRQMRSILGKQRSLNMAFAKVFTYRSPPWLVCSMLRMAQIKLHLAEVIENAPLPIIPGLKWNATNTRAYRSQLDSRFVEPLERQGIGMLKILWKKSMEMGIRNTCARLGNHLLRTLQPHTPIFREGTFLTPELQTGIFMTLNQHKGISKKLYSLYAQTHKKFEKYQEKEAREILLSVLKQSPTYYPALINMGLSWYREKRYGLALYFLRLATQYHPKKHSGFHYLGLAHLQQKNQKLAIHSLKKAVTLLKYPADSHNVLGSLLASHGQLKKAISHFRKAFQYNPRYDHTRYNLALALHRIGKPFQAIQHHIKLFQRKKPFVRSSYHLGLHHLERQSKLGLPARKFFLKEVTAQHQNNPRLLKYVKQINRYQAASDYLSDFQKHLPKRHLKNYPSQNKYLQLANNKLFNYQRVLFGQLKELMKAEAKKQKNQKKACTCSSSRSLFSPFNSEEDPFGNKEVWKNFFRSDP